ncbi:hypothetical protein GCM10028798_09120 [Humibacter antri]
MATAIAVLSSSARAIARQGQVDFARSAGVRQATVSEAETAKTDVRTSTLQAFLAVAGLKLTAIPSAYPTAAETAWRIRRSLDGESRDAALRNFLDLAQGLAAEDGVTRAALSVLPPATTGSRDWDAALAGLVEYRLEEVGIAAPAWTAEPERVALRLTSPQLGEYDLLADAENSLLAFLRHNVALEPETLGSV